MHDQLVEAIENLLLDELGYKIMPSEAADLAVQVMDLIRDIIEESLEG